MKGYWLKTWNPSKVQLYVGGNIFFVDIIKWLLIYRKNKRNTSFFVLSKEYHDKGNVKTKSGTSSNKEIILKQNEKTDTNEYFECRKCIYRFRFSLISTWSALNVLNLQLN